MKTWIVILTLIALTATMAYFGVKAYCHYLELNVAYTNPQVKYVRKSAKASTITIHSDTKVNIAKSDRIQLLPDGSYTFFNPTDIVLSSSTSVTNHSTEETTENGTSKPLLPPQSVHDWIIAINYTHLNNSTDIQSLTCYKRFIGDLYVGFGIYMRMDMFAEDYTPTYHWQNITVGIAYIF